MATIDDRRKQNRRVQEDRRNTRDEYHYRVFSDGNAITRKQAINIIVNSHADLSECYGICFMGPSCLLQYVNFKEMTSRELALLALNRVGSNDYREK
jgi:hypothetical protein